MPRVTSATSKTLTLRIEVVGPVSGCAYALQKGRDELEQVQVAKQENLSFTFSVELKLSADGSLDSKGPHVQGPRGNRFVYINSGTMAGQPMSCWTRRAKVSLRTLYGAAAEAVSNKLEVHIVGSAGDGGPACASVALLDDGWRSAK